MRKDLRNYLLILLTVILFVSVNCSQNIRFDSPTTAYKNYFEALQKDDVAAMKQSFSKQTLEIMDGYAKREKKSINDQYKMFLETFKKQSAKTLEFRNEKIEGDKGSLEVKQSDEKWETKYFVKEDNGWKISLVDFL